MSVKTKGTEDESQPGAAESATAPLLIGATTTSDRCPNCAAEMAPDQRYCVECGTRRGRPRFSLQPPSAGPRPAESPALATPSRGGLSANATLLAGLAVLLLAIGVGVLIGNSISSKGNQRPINNVTVNGGGSGGSAAGSTAASSGTSTGASSSTGSSSAGSSSSTKPGASTKKSVKASTGNNTAATKANAPSSSSGVSKSVTKTPSVKPGGSCAAGTPGCSNGKETGTFF